MGLLLIHQIQGVGRCWADRCGSYDAGAIVETVRCQELLPVPSIPIRKPDLRSNSAPGPDAKISTPYSRHSASIDKMPKVVLRSPPRCPSDQPVRNDGSRTG